MARYRSAPSFAHDRPTRLGVLLINLGTPDAPTTAAVRRYLAQFLSDPRVNGIPRRTLALGDPYHCHCQKTARLVAAELGLKLNGEQAMLTFQSRFGRAAWLTPYTQPTLVALAKERVGRVDVVCPGFVSDCLETLEEIAQEGQAAFLKAGGGEFHYIACLNERPAWIAALADLAVRNLGGWLEAPPDASARELTEARAKALGAK